MNKAGMFGLNAIRIQPMVQVKEHARKHKRLPIWNQKFRLDCYVVVKHFYFAVQNKEDYVSFFQYKVKPVT